LNYTGDIQAGSKKRVKEDKDEEQNNDLTPQRPMKKPKPEIHDYLTINTAKEVANDQPLPKLSEKGDTKAGSSFHRSNALCL
jgi:hypothetical protein